MLRYFVAERNLKPNMLGKVPTYDIHYTYLTMMFQFVLQHETEQQIMEGTLLAKYNPLELSHHTLFPN